MTKDSEMRARAWQQPKECDSWLDVSMFAIILQAMGEEVDDYEMLFSDHLVLKGRNVCN